MGGLTPWNALRKEIFRVVPGLKQSVKTLKRQKGSLILDQIVSSPANPFAGSPPCQPDVRQKGPALSAQEDLFTQGF